MWLSTIERYLLFGAAQVEGWLHPHSAEFIWHLAQIQTAAGFEGAVDEIGVHHGRLLILLLLCKLPAERAFAIDVFERQYLNTDHSGHGDLCRLQNNVRRWAGAMDVSIISKSSLEVSPAEILDRCGRVRLASIDGGHTAECTYKDLMLIDKVLAEHGVAVLDDYFNSDWPDISSGTARYLLDTNSTLRPFAISPNKVYLCRSDYSTLYRERIATGGVFRHPKQSTLFDSDVDIYSAPPVVPPFRVYWRELLKRSLLGPYLLAARTVIAKRKRDRLPLR